MQDVIFINCCCLFSSSLKHFFDDFGQWYVHNICFQNDSGQHCCTHMRTPASNLEWVSFCQDIADDFQIFHSEGGGGGTVSNTGCGIIVGNIQSSAAFRDFSYWGGKAHLQQELECSSHFDIFPLRLLNTSSIIQQQYC